MGFWFTLRAKKFHLRDMSLAGRFSYILSPQRLDFVGGWVIWMKLQMEIDLTARCSLVFNAYCIMFSWSPKQIRSCVLFSSRKERLEILLSMSALNQARKKTGDKGVSVAL